MNIPLNGRIAIVDDKYKEVKPLMDMFSKKRIPFNYYTGLKSSDLPLDSSENPISLLFLDLNIVETQHNPKVVISTLHPILKSICPGKSTPYFLIVWSKKINDFADHLEGHFKSSHDLKFKSPVKFIRLNKGDFFNLDNGSYIFDETKYDLLVETLKAELENVSVLKNFFSWENIVHRKTAETTTEFSSFYPIDIDWNKNTKAIIFHLAKAVIGNDEIRFTSDEMKLLYAFSSINSFLFEKIQNSIIEDKLGEISNIKDDIYDGNNKKDGLRRGIKESLNSKLHLMSLYSKLSSFEQGNIYKIPKGGKILKRIFLKEKYDNNKILRTSILKSRPALIQLDLTPVCDYSQDKKYIRLVYGALISSKFSAINIKSDFQRQTPVFNIDGKEMFFIIDYRLIITMTKEEIIKRKIAPILRLRREICTDMQSQLSNQINRPGISNV